MFLDMCWDQPSSSRWAIAGMRSRGLDPQNAADHEQYGREVAQAYMERFCKMVEPHLVNLSPTGVWFNSRDRSWLGEVKRFLRHVEVEALPTGSWGYDYLPYIGRLVRSFALPVVSQTGRFHRSWGDMASLKAPASLKYDLARTMLYGHSWSIGDLLAPTAKPSAAVYSLIGTAYSYIEGCEVFIEGTRPLVDIGLVTDLTLGDRPGSGVIGAVKVLGRCRQQFDVLSKDADLEAYRVVVVPDGQPITEDLADKLVRRIASGKRVLLAASGCAGGLEGRSSAGTLWRSPEGAFAFHDRLHRNRR